MMNWRKVKLRIIFKVASYCFVFANKALLVNNEHFLPNCHKINKTLMFFYLTETRPEKTPRQNSAQFSKSKYVLAPD